MVLGFRCSRCHKCLSSWYFEKNGELFCKQDYWSLYGDSCNRCGLIITGPVMVRSEAQSLIMQSRSSFVDRSIKLQVINVSQQISTGKCTNRMISENELLYLALVKEHLQLKKSNAPDKLRQVSFRVYTRKQCWPVF